MKIRKTIGSAVIVALTVMTAVGGIAPVEAKSLAPQGAAATELKGLDRILAIEEMKDLRLTFCRSLDNRNWDALRATMADDFELYFAQTEGPDGPNMRPPAQLVGADKFIDFVKQLLQGQSIHICTMAQFETVTADRARALWFINGYGAIGGQTGLGFERLVEDYVKINGKWLIKKADGRVEAQVNFPK
ncbi:nuclear transport factor 2 family protein [Sphingobium sp. C100]|uniref:nuclear transport factor 2 family protein n=1 Tax=Sphingobium sp. C100 TaxID=1207055 RepID=UPI0013782581|nr:nuclear transport factor 2 family protein [Sphingobium sp. C100]